MCYIFNFQNIIGVRYILNSFVRMYDTIKSFFTFAYEKFKYFLHMNNNPLSDLPKKNQNEIYRVVNMIKGQLPEAGLIILYGSFARNDYVPFDSRIEWNVNTSYTSDYDILVITRGISAAKANNILNNVEDNYYEWGKDIEHLPTLGLIQEDIAELNKKILDSNFFYNEMLGYCKILYDDGTLRLQEPIKLNHSQAKKIAQKYFDINYKDSQQHLEAVQVLYQQKLYKEAYLMLHQAYEKGLSTISLVYTHNSKKEHNLDKLVKNLKGFVPEIMTVFDLKDEEQKRLWNKLKDSYKAPRYNFDYVVVPEDITKIIPYIEKLHKIVKTASIAKIKEYEDKAKEENKK